MTPTCICVEIEHAFQPPVGYLGMSGLLLQAEELLDKLDKIPVVMCIVESKCSVSCKEFSLPWCYMIRDVNINV